MSAAPAATARPSRAAVRFGGSREHLPWAGLALLLVAAAAVVYLHPGRPAPFPSSDLALGGAAAASYLSAHAYALRKRAGIGRFRPLRPWYLAHAWLTTAGLGVALLHARFRTGGLVEGSLLAGFALAVASGAGLALFHTRFKRWMVRLEGEHLLPEDIAEGRQRIATEVRQLLEANRAEVRVLALNRVIRPARSAPTLLRLFRGGEAARRTGRAIAERLAPELRSCSEAEREVLRRIASAEVERRRLQLQALLHALRRAWTALHVVLASAVLTLLGLHVLLVWYY